MPSKTMAGSPFQENGCLPDGIIRSCSAGTDETDLGMSRKTGDLVPKKADLWDNFVALFSIVTYVTDIVTDALVAHKYFSSGDWWWFAQTIVFIIAPSVILQILSCKWYVDDKAKLIWWEWLVHLLQLGPIKRYICAFWYGLQTWHTAEVRIYHYQRYLTEWRDITMLHLLEGFTEAAPQMILQLYVLATLGRPFSWKSDWRVTASAGTSIVSLSWALVSYNHALRLCVKQKGLSICGYVFQTAYRICIVASRVLILVLFAWEYKLWIYLFCTSHWLAMLLWLRQYPTRFCSADGESPKLWSERFFSGLIAFIYIFCFINTVDSTTRQRVSFYYFIFFVENISLIVLWYMRRVEFGWMEYSALIIICGGFFAGVTCMLCYHKFFHPSQDITEGWLCCKVCQGRANDDTPFQIIGEPVETGPGPSSSSQLGSASILTRSVSDPNRIADCSASIPHQVSASTWQRAISNKSQHGILRSFISRSHNSVPVDVELALRSAISSDNLYRVVGAGTKQNRVGDRTRKDVGKLISFGNLDDGMRPSIEISSPQESFVSAPQGEGMVSSRTSHDSQSHLRLPSPSPRKARKKRSGNAFLAYRRQLTTEPRLRDRSGTREVESGAAVALSVRGPTGDGITPRAMQLITYL